MLCFVGWGLTDFHYQSLAIIHRAREALLPAELRKISAASRLFFRQLARMWVGIMLGLGASDPSRCSNWAQMRASGTLGLIYPVHTASPRS